MSESKDAEPKPLSEPLPELEAEGSPSGVAAQVQEAAKRGKLAGFMPARGDELFRLEAFAQPFESEVLARASEKDGRTRLRFERRMKRLMPAVFLVLLLVSVEPGQYFVDKLIPGAWGWWPTWWWYYPLAMLGVLSWPWLVIKSRKQGHAEAHAMVQKVADVLKAARAGAGRQEEAIGRSPEDGSQGSGGLGSGRGDARGGS